MNFIKELTIATGTPALSNSSQRNSASMSVSDLARLQVKIKFSLLHQWSNIFHWYANQNYKVHKILESLRLVKESRSNILF